MFKCVLSPFTRIINIALPIDRYFIFKRPTIKQNKFYRIFTTMLPALLWTLSSESPYQSSNNNINPFYCFVLLVL